MNYEIKKPQPFNLRETLNCGQCFRFEEAADGVFFGVVKSKLIKVKEVFIVLQKRLYQILFLI